MKILVCLYFSLLSAVSIKDANIYSLFYHWNKISISALARYAASPANEAEKELYQYTLPVLIDYWNNSPDDFKNRPLRWLFLEEISKEFDWKDKEWSVIEIIKSGEIKRIINYLIYYEGKQTHIAVYEYYSDKWTRIDDRQDRFLISDLINKKDRVPAYEGGNSCDVVVTNFKSALPVTSAYYVSNTLAKGSRAARIIWR